MLDRPGTYCVIDASSTRTFCGIFAAGAWQATATSADETLVALFECAERIRIREALAQHSFKGFICANGPGSILGIRLSLMALAGWRALLPERSPVMSYNALHAAAIMLYSSQSAPPRFTIVSEFRNERWIRIECTTGTALGDTPTFSTPQLTDIETVEASDHPVYWIPQRRRHGRVPSNAILLPYDLRDDIDWLSHLPLTRWNRIPDVFVIEDTAYVKWTSQRHR